MSEKFHKTCMELGRATGCHQLPERSFFLRGKQFPVCARCTGVIAGQIAALASYRLFQLPIYILIIFCAIMLADWALQYFKILASRNWRRLITGALCGYAFGNITIRLFVVLIGL